MINLFKRLTNKWITQSSPRSPSSRSALHRHAQNLEMILHPEHLGKIAQLRDQPHPAYHRVQKVSLLSVKRGTQGIGNTRGINDAHDIKGGKQDLVTL